MNPSRSIARWSSKLFLATAVLAGGTALAQPVPPPAPQPQPQPVPQPSALPPASAQPVPSNPPPLMPPPGQPAPVVQPAPSGWVPPPGSRIIVVRPGQSTDPNQPGTDNSLVTRPVRLKYEPGDVIPPGYYPRDRNDPGLLISGLSIFGASYGVSLISGVILGADSHNSGALALLVPLAGPFITIGTEETREAGTVGLALDGIIQITGAALFFASFGVKNHYLLRVANEPGLSVQVGATSGSLKLTF